MPSLNLKQGSRIYHLQYELIYKDNRVKRYKIHPVKNPDLYIVLENNEPFIGGKGLKKRRIEWKQIEGPTRSQATLDQIIKEITNPTKPQREIIFKADTYNRKKKPRDQTTLSDRL